MQKQFEENRMEQYKKRVTFSYRVFLVRLGKRHIRLWFKGYFINPEKLVLGEQLLELADGVRIPVQCNSYSGKLPAKKALLNNPMTCVCVKTAEVAVRNGVLNNPVRIWLNVEGTLVPYYIACPIRKKNFDERYYYLPWKRTVKNGFSLHFRRGGKGALTLVRRPLEDYERTWRYRLFENRVVSAVMYWMGRCCRRFSKTQVLLFYEKFAKKAEEGVYELCRMVQEQSKAKAYFILDENSDDYKRLKADAGVVAKYSFRYYWLVYRVNLFVATEAPSHLNVMRSVNYWLRRSHVDNRFVFLQHGIIYMKNLGKNCTFIQGKEGAPDYMVVSSEKEGRVAAQMLQMKPEQLWNTGLAIFDKMTQNIDAKSQNLVTVFLTWKPYEEYIQDFTETEYYRTIVATVELLAKYIPRERIAVCAHPKVEGLIKNTPLYGSMWQQPVFDLIAKTKLLITDYSSICYQSFFRGAGVIFYQYDLERYEQATGPLIPQQEEYIGPRVFDRNQLEQVISDIIKDGEICLEQIRTAEYERRYAAINQWKDGHNTQRICERLLALLGEKQQKNGL